MTGSTPYMAPENLLGKPYGKPADVFSFGVLVWEMLHCTFAVGGRRIVHISTHGLFQSHMRYRHFMITVSPSEYMGVQGSCCRKE